MRKQTRPTITHQIIVHKPVTCVFNAMRNQNLVAKFWLADSTEGLFKENQISLWTWPDLEEALVLTVRKIIPEKLISLVWQDTFVTLDIKFTALFPDATLLELVVHNFSEQEFNLIKSIRAMQSTFNIVENEINIYFKHLDDNNEKKNSLVLKTYE